MNTTLNRFVFIFLLVFCIGLAIAQTGNSSNDPQAAALLQKVSEKYNGYKSVSAEFKLLVQRPKLKPEESDKKYTDTLTGKVLLQQAKFSVDIRGQQIICDGKNIWTYTPADKEVQVNYFEESDEMFSPAKIFNMYKEGYAYQVKEKKTVGSKNLTVIEMAPNKKLSYFKVDVGIDEATLQVIELKVYEKNGVRYVYKLTKQTPNVTTNADSFTFDAKKYPGVKVVDLR